MNGDILREALKKKGYESDGNGGYKKSSKRPEPTTQINCAAKKLAKNIYGFGQKSKLEQKFDALWQELGGPSLVKEHRFHKTRRWRFDRASVEHLVAVEINGGVYSNGRHTRGSGYVADRAKVNTATAMGWRVFELTAEMLNEKCLRQILFLFQ